MPDEGLRDYGQACDKTSDCKGGICATRRLTDLHALLHGGPSVRRWLEVRGTCLPQMYSRSTPKVERSVAKWRATKTARPASAAHPAPIRKRLVTALQVVRSRGGLGLSFYDAVRYDRWATGNNPRCVMLGAGELGAAESGCSVADPASRADSSAVRLFGGGAAVVLLGLWAATRRRRSGPAL